MDAGTKSVLTVIGALSDTVTGTFHLCLLLNFSH